jgi:hypothetical protein
MLVRAAGTVCDPFLHFTFLIHMHVIRRSSYDLVGGFNAEIRYGDEIDFHLRMTERFAAPGNYAYIDDVAYLYRQNSAGVCSVQEKYISLIHSIEEIMLRHARRRGLEATSCSRVGKLSDGAVRYQYGFDIGRGS